MSEFAPRSRVKIIAYGPFGGRFGHIVQYLRTTHHTYYDEYEGEEIHTNLRHYLVQVGDYQLSFSETELLSWQQ
jgi:aspartate aminotransferase-like enzyme